MEAATDNLSRGWREGLRLALPSDGELHEPSLQFLRSCGLGVDRTSTRRYTGALSALPGATALFQRAADITSKVEEGSADLGIVGLDRFMESRREGGDALLVVDDLGFGRCELVLAVPESWVDVVSTADLADLAVEFRESGRELRIATKYLLLVERFLYARGINYFTLVQASGTLEAAPALGYADLIADLTASGVTLRDNGLKTLADGSILVSQACVIANRRLLVEEDAKLQQAKEALERIEGFLRAQGLCSVTAHLPGTSTEAVASQITHHPQLWGDAKPTISMAPAPQGGQWHAVTLLVPKPGVLKAVEQLRRMGGDQIAVTPVTYLFLEECAAYQRLLASAQRE